MSAKALFSKDATVEYRVIPTLDGGVQWHWVLFNALDKVLGGGTARTRGKAGTQARRKARQLNRNIHSVRVSGLLAEAKLNKSVSVRDFISRMGAWMDVADKSGYKPTQDRFWAKAAQGEPIYARKIEGTGADYIISVFGGTGKAKDGGQLVWVALDFEDTGNHSRVPLHTLLSTDKLLPYVLSALEAEVYDHGENWQDVDRYVGELRKARPVIEAAEDTGHHQRLPADPVKDFIMGTATWQERLQQMSKGRGPTAYAVNDPKMEKSANWAIEWDFKDFYIQLSTLVRFKTGHLPCGVDLLAVYGSYVGGSTSMKWFGSEYLDVDGDSQMNEFVDHLEPVVQQVEKWHNAKELPSEWDFAKIVSRLHTWMTNHPVMKDYI